MIYCCAGGCSLSHIGMGGLLFAAGLGERAHIVILSTTIAPCLRAVGLSEELSDRENEVNYVE